MAVEEPRKEGDDGGIARSSLDPNYVSAGPDDPIYLRGEGFVGVSFLGPVLMSVVYRSNAGDGVAKAALRDIGIDASTAHQAPSSTAQVVMHVIAYAARLIEHPLEPREPRNWRLAVGGEYKVALLRRQDCEGSLRQRPD